MAAAEYVVWSHAVGANAVHVWQPDDAAPRRQMALGVTRRGAIVPLFGGALVLAYTAPHTFVLISSGSPAATAKPRMVRWSFPEAVTCLAASRDAKLMFAGCANGKVYAWETSTGVLCRVWDAHVLTVTCMRLTDDSALLITGGEDSVAYAWAVSDIFGAHLSVSVRAAIKPRVTYDGHSLPIRDVDVGCGTSANGVLVTVGDDARALLWHVASGARIRDFVLPSAACSVKVNHMSSRAYVGMKNGHIACLYLVPTSSARSQSRVELLLGHAAAVVQVEVSWCDSWLISASEDGTLRRWDANSQICLSVYDKHHAPLTGIMLLRRTDSEAGNLVEGGGISSTVSGKSDAPPATGAALPSLPFAEFPFAYLQRQLWNHNMADQNKPYCPVVRAPALPGHARSHNGSDFVNALIDTSLYHSEREVRAQAAVPGHAVASTEADTGYDPMHPSSVATMEIFREAERLRVENERLRQAGSALYALCVERLLL
ncbi:WD repeat-containing protein 18 [Porphyridium purpureum]|uniref:WD repeat-containing protein 18 n=1 Tax=Porphyridium purpureum TaxID=35688 RepID=A0A5J4YTV2_PORPP|nr:WD repeat-containing protein 18 [Porphyridium purpureum]|eukprot:POR0680..scf227_4